MINGWLLMGGLFLIGVGAGTSDSGHFGLGIAIGFKGLMMVFLSFGQNRNMLHRKFLILKQEILGLFN